MPSAPARGGDSSASHIQSMENGDSNVLVCVRVRPENEREKESKKRNIIRVLDKVVIFDPAQDTNGSVGGPVRRRFTAKRTREHRFAFDRVFDDSSTQEEVFQGSTQFLINGILDGYNATVFAYGATGAGKTYTMMGHEDTGPGIMLLTLIELFNQMNTLKDSRNHKVSVQYLEVYNERIKDLLDPENAGNEKGLNLVEDPKKGVYVANLTRSYPETPEDIIELLKQGNLNRTQHPTDANKTSSRSHAVVQITVESKPRTGATNTEMRVGKLSLIDLAGSERAAATTNNGLRFREGANINRSLLALGNCINALASSTGKRVHIPYRDSKLTRLLKDSLGGNCRTVMITNISPSELTYEDTLNSLKYANRAKNIKMKVTRNALNVNYHISQYQKIISDLQAEVRELKVKVVESEKLAGQGQTTAEVEQRKLEEAEREEMEYLREEVVQTFREHARVKRSLMDLEESERQLAYDLARKKAELDEWMRAHPGQKASELPVRIRSLQRDLRQGQEAQQANVRQKRELLARIAENADISSQLQEELPKRIRTTERRNFLQQEVRLHQVDTKYMELERKMATKEALLDEKEQQIKSLEANLAGVLDLLGDCMEGLAANDLLTSDIEERQEELTRECHAGARDRDYHQECNKENRTRTLPDTPFRDFSFTKVWGENAVNDGVRRLSYSGLAALVSPPSSKNAGSRPSTAGGRMDCASTRPNLPLRASNAANTGAAGGKTRKARPSALPKAPNGNNNNNNNSESSMPPPMSARGRLETSPKSFARGRPRVAWGESSSTSSSNAPQRSSRVPKRSSSKETGNRRVGFKLPLSNNSAVNSSNSASSADSSLDESNLHVDDDVEARRPSTARGDLQRSQMSVPQPTGAGFFRDDSSLPSFMRSTKASSLRKSRNLGGAQRMKRANTEPALTRPVSAPSQRRSDSASNIPTTPRSNSSSRSHTPERPAEATVTPGKGVMIPKLNMTAVQADC